MTDAAIGFGSKFERSSDGTSAGIFATVAQMRDIPFPEVSRDIIDGTHMESPDGYREFVPGLADGGELSLEMLFKSGGTGYTTLLADFHSAAPGYYKITLVGGDTFEFSGFVKGLSGTAPLADAMTATVTIKITGKPIYTKI